MNTRVIVASSALLALAGCGGSDNSSGTSSGGATATATGGFTAAGQSSSAGGQTNSGTSTTGGTASHQTSSPAVTGGTMNPSGGNTAAATTWSGGSNATTPVSTIAAGGVVGFSGGTMSTGGVIATGGKATQVGGAGTGGVVSVGGTQATGGASDAGVVSTDAGPVTSVTMALTPGASANDALTLNLTLPVNAAPIAVADLTITWCSRLGGGTQLIGSDLTFDQVALICPVNGPPDCSQAQYYDLRSSLSVSVLGSGMNGCYVIEFPTSTSTLYQGGSLKMVLRLDSSPQGAFPNATYEEMWTVLVNDVAAGQCTVPAWPATKVVCGS